MELDIANQYKKLQLQELQKIWNNTYENLWIYKEKMKAFHDKQTLKKNFEVGHKDFYFILVLSYFCVSYVLNGLGILLLLMFFVMVQLRLEA